MGGRRRQQNRGAPHVAATPQAIPHWHVAHPVPADHRATLGALLRHEDLQRRRVPARVGHRRLRAARRLQTPHDLRVGGRGGERRAPAAPPLGGLGDGGFSGPPVLLHDRRRERGRRQRRRLLLYVGCYQFSFGPITWLINGEIYPAAVRTQALALASMLNFGSNAVVGYALPSLQDSVGMSTIYLLFAGVGMTALLSIYLTVPETKGKTLEEIEAM